MIPPNGGSLLSDTVGDREVSMRRGTWDTNRSQKNPCEMLSASRHHWSPPPALPTSVTPSTVFFFLGQNTPLGSTQRSFGPRHSERHCCPFRGSFVPGGHSVFVPTSAVTVICSVLKPGGSYLGLGRLESSLVIAHVLFN